MKVPEYDTSWADRLKWCPYCGAEVKLEVTQLDPDIAMIECDCGYTASATAPTEISPLKGVIKEIRL